MSIKNNWKNSERRIANLFRTRRTPLSGGNSGHTRSDTLSDKFFVETKYRQGGFYSTNLWRKTKELAVKEKKIPVVALIEKGSPFQWLLIERKDLFKLLEFLNEK